MAGGGNSDQVPQSDLTGRLGHDFADARLLTRALTHASSDASGTDTNQRLEFLGDRVLGLVIAENLLNQFPDETESAIAPRHSELVRAETLAVVARDIGLGAHIILSKGEEENGGRDNPSILADAMEAVIAALYLDGGLATARRFILGNWPAEAAASDSPPKDAKTRLQEWAQGKGLALPEYAETGRDGPAHAPEFTIEVRVEGQAPANARGPSKRIAEQAAAAALLERLGLGRGRKP